MRTTLGLWIVLGTATASAQTPALLHFDVASVKVVDRSSLGRGGWGNIAGGPGTSDPGRFTAPVATMLGLLNTAFGVEQGQILGAAVQFKPGESLYSVTATMPPETTKAQFQTMFQNLLIERFHLVFHHETRNAAGYELVVDKGGTKLKEGKALDDGPGPAGRRTNFQNVRAGNITLSEQPISELAKRLGMAYWTVEAIQTQNMMLPMPRVIDKTGLTRKYSFSLDYSPPGAITGPDDSATDLPDLVVALRKQLGLDLNKIAGVAVDVIVVDSVDNVPTEN